MLVWEVGRCYCVKVWGTDFGRRFNSLETRFACGRVRELECAHPTVHACLNPWTDVTTVRGEGVQVSAWEVVRDKYCVSKSQDTVGRWKLTGHMVENAHIHTH